ncbi:MAG: hypothetical protein JWP97_1275 [Labilithrix sp.]|nr:hypothetical protein [Labilithrix sp.]
MPSWLLTAVFVLFVGLLLYRRFRATFGRQKLSPVRMVLRAVLLAVVAVALLVVSHAPAAIAASTVGLGMGIGLSFLGMRHTKVESTPQGVFYTPNRWLGIGVTALVLGRLAARIFSVYAAVAANPALARGGAPSFGDAQKSPWTLGMFFVMGGYYVAYYVHLWRAARTMKVDARAEAPPGRPRVTLAGGGGSVDRGV